MSTKLGRSSVGEFLLGKVRARVLGLLYGHPDESFYLRQIVRQTGAGLGSVQREVAGLRDANLISREQRGRQVFFQANRRSELFEPLRALTDRSAGLADTLRTALEPDHDRIRCAFVYGSCARGTAQADSDVDLFVIGDAAPHEIADRLFDTQARLSREVNPTVMPAGEFSRRAAGDAFLRRVLDGPKIFLIGDERVLGGLA